MIELLSKYVEDGDVDGCVNDDIRYEELDYNFCPLLWIRKKLSHVVARLQGERVLIA